MFNDSEFELSLDHGTNWLLHNVITQNEGIWSRDQCASFVSAWLRDKTRVEDYRCESLPVALPEWRFHLALLDAWLYPPSWTSDREIAGAYSKSHYFVRLFLCNRGVDDACAEELAQDVLSKLWECRGLIYCGHAPAYVRGVARNKLKEYWRNCRAFSSHVKLTESETHDSGKLEFMGDIFGADVRALTRNHAKELPPKQKEMVGLVLGGNTPSEAAHLMGITRQSGCKLLQKAISRIRARLFGGNPIYV